VLRSGVHELSVCWAPTSHINCQSDNSTATMLLRCIAARTFVCCGGGVVCRQQQAAACTCQSQTTIHKPQATSHKPQATSHKPQATSHKPTDTIVNQRKQHLHNYAEGGHGGTRPHCVHCMRKYHLYIHSSVGNCCAHDRCFAWILSSHFSLVLLRPLQRVKVKPPCLTSGKL